MKSLFSNPADAREFVHAAAGLVTGRAALRAIGADTETLQDRAAIKAMSDEEILRIANELRKEMERRYPAIFAAPSSR